MLKIGDYQDLNVNREVEFGFYLGNGREEVLLPNKYVPEGLKVNDTLCVFVYKDSEDRPVATTLEPIGKVGDIVPLVVKDETEHGAYMDWGLEKDLFVPRREQHVKFEHGKTYVVRISMDYQTSRLIGTSKLQAFFRKDTEALEEGQKEELLIFAQTDLGWKAVIDGEFFGLLYGSESPEHLQIGDRLPGFIHRVREDGKIDLRLSAEGQKGMDMGRETLLACLKANDGILPINDKSSPEQIYATVEMSKKLFKKALGMLYKDRIVEIREDSIALRDTQGS